MSPDLVIGLVIALVIVEFVVLAVWRIRGATGMPVAELVAFLGSGLFLLVAMRFLATDGPVAGFTGALAISLVLHLWMIRLRWQR